MDQESIPGDALLLAKCIVEDHKCTQEQLDQPELRDQLIKAGLKGQHFTYVLAQQKQLPTIPLSFFVEHKIAYLSYYFSILETKAQQGSVEAAKFLTSQHHNFNPRNNENPSNVLLEKSLAKKRKAKKQKQSDTVEKFTGEIPF